MTNPKYQDTTALTSLSETVFCILKIQQTWKESPIFVFILPPKDQFCFLFMFRTSAAKVCHQKNCALKHKLLSPQDSYKGEKGGKQKIFNVPNILYKSFNVNLHKC